MKRKTKPSVSRRDTFAAQALNAMIIAESFNNPYTVHNMLICHENRLVSSIRAYLMADTMIEASKLDLSSYE
jgi:hypothetical protein